MIDEKTREIANYAKGYVPIYNFKSQSFILIPYDAIVEEILSNQKWQGTFISCNKAITKEDCIKLEKITKE